MAIPVTGQLFHNVDGSAFVHGQGRETFDSLVVGNRFLLERIVSHAHATPPGQWYDQPRREWVALLCGSAEVEFEGEPAARLLNPGDWLDIPAHCRHRVAWTSAAEPTVWLALHYESADEQSANSRSPGASA
jgi:cupin 2 domain-containing protein